MRAMFLLTSVACTGPSSTSSPRATGGSPDLPPVAEAMPSAMFERVGTGRCGHALAWVRHELLIGCPGAGSNGRTTGRAWTFDAGGEPVRIYDSGCEGETCSWNDLGSAVAAPGDVTGDGVVDLALASGASEPMEGWHDARRPLSWRVSSEAAYEKFREEPKYRWLGPTRGVRRSWGAGRSTPCGDLDGNGVAELCLDTGVVFGPILDGAVPDVRWKAADALVSDGAAGLWIAAANELYHVPALARVGEVELADLAEATLPLAEPATALALGDLDGDRVVDPIVASASRVTAGGTVLELPAEALAVGDFDGDGLEDLAVGGGGELTVWFGPLQGGTFGPEVADRRWRGEQYPTDRLGAALAAADVDGDGVTDLAIGAPDHLVDASPYNDDFAEHPRTPAGRVWWWNGLP